MGEWDWMEGWIERAIGGQIGAYMYAIQIHQINKKISKINFKKRRRYIGLESAVLNRSRKGC